MRGELHPIKRRLLGMFVHFKQVKNAATTVVTNDDLHPRRALTALLNQQRGCIVQERNVTDHQSCGPGACLCVLTELTANGHSERSRDRAIDPGQPAIRVHGNALTANATIKVTNQARCRQHQPVMRPGVLPNRIDQHFSRQLLTRNRKLLSPKRGTLARFNAAGCGNIGRLRLTRPGTLKLLRCRQPLPQPSLRLTPQLKQLIAGRVVRRTKSAHPHDIDVFSIRRRRKRCGCRSVDDNDPQIPPLHEGSHLAAKGRPTVHDHLLNIVAQARNRTRLTQQIPIGNDQVATKPRTTCNLGN